MSASCASRSGSGRAACNLCQHQGDHQKSQIEAEFRTRPAIVARAVTLTNDPTMAWNEPPAEAQGVAAGQAPIKELSMLTGPGAQQTIDRPVELPAVTVQQVIGDRSFWVGPRASERVLVVLAPAPGTPAAGKAAEGKLTIEKGQTVALTGTVMRVPATAAERDKLDLSDTAERAITSQPVYLQASKVEVTAKARAAGRRPPR